MDHPNLGRSGLVVSRLVLGMMSYGDTSRRAWHLDLEHDVRSLMSVEPNTEWYETTHHELGHIYYYLCYTNPEVPLLLREGANRAYHEAVGSLMGLAAMQPRFRRPWKALPEQADAPWAARSTWRTRAPSLPLSTKCANSSGGSTFWSTTRP